MKSRSSKRGNRMASTEMALRTSLPLLTRSVLDSASAPIKTPARLQPLTPASFCSGGLQAGIYVVSPFGVRRLDAALPPLRCHGACPERSRRERSAAQSRNPSASGHSERSEESTPQCQSCRGCCRHSLSDGACPERSRRERSAATRSREPALSEAEGNSFLPGASPTLSAHFRTWTPTCKIAPLWCILVS